MSYRRFYTPQRDSSERHPRNLDPTLQLQRDRISNDLKLKSRFEHIFEKYAKDFSNVGDEIDMETGEVVVNNGHLEYMQHERDVGSTASSQFLAAFEEELEVENGDGGEHGQNEDVDGASEDDLAPQITEPETEEHEDNEEDGDDEEDELSIDHTDSQRTSMHISRSHTPATIHYEEHGYDTDRNAHDVEDAEDSGDEDEYAHATSRHEHLDSSPHDGRSSSTSSSDRHDYALDKSIVQSTEMLPFSMEESLNALAAHQDDSGRIDPAAIQDLSMSIANQIANFLTHFTTGRLNHQPHHSRDPWSVPPLPKDAFAPPMSLRRATPDSQRHPSVMDSPGASSLWAPVPDARRTRPTKRLKKVHQIDPDLLADGEQEDSPSSREASEAPDYAPAYAQHSIPPYPLFYSKTNTKFSRQEDELIKRLREVDGMSWKQMTAYFPQRSAVGLQSRYTRAARHLPRPVVVKREIVEILDGDDDTQSESTPNWRLIPPHSNHASLGPPETPLLRRALGNHPHQRDDSPVTIPDDDDTETTPSHPAYSSMPPPGYGYPPPGYFYPPPGQQGYPYTPYGGYPPPNGMWYPQMKPPKVPKPRAYHNKPESQPRHTRFDTTQGDGRFGILKTDKPMQMARESTAQQHIIGPMTASTGAFGVLRVGKSKGKRPNYPRRQRQASTPIPYKEGDPHAFARPSSQAPPPEPFRPGFDYIAANAQRASQEPNGADEPLRVISLLSEEPNNSPYPDEMTEANDGPYFLGNVARVDGHKSDDAPFLGEDGHQQQMQDSSPALPTPPSDSSVKFTRPKTHGVAPEATMVAPKAVTATPGTTMAKKRASSVYGTPTPATQPRVLTPDIGVVRVRPRPIHEDSDDELA